MAESFDPQQTAEFDRHARGYHDMHAASIAASGEDPEYFAVYKQRTLERILGKGFARPLLDFGCGIGNLTKHLAESFPDVDGYDPSSESTSLAKGRAPRARFFHDTTSLKKGHYGAAVVANVLHHVPPAERDALLLTVVERLATGGRLIVFEHNPLNPLTRRAVNACPFDENAVLLSPWEVTRRLRDAGLHDVQRQFIVFFPHFLAPLRPIEPSLGWLPIGAQVVASGLKR